MKLEELKGKKILIVGAGIEGKAVYVYLKRYLPGVRLDIVDQKDGKSYLTSQKNYDIAIKSPGVKPELITIPYTTATNIFLSNAKGRVIGVTGTKGKSTTSILIYRMLRKQGLNAYLGGNIGQSPLDFIDNLNDKSWTVLEMSSYQLNDSKISPHVAVVLMITQEHLDYHKTQEVYVSAKRNILRFQTPQDFAIINKDYPASHESDILTLGKVFQVSRKREITEGCFVRDGKIVVRTLGKLGESAYQNIRASDNQTSPTNRQAESSEFSEMEIIETNKIRLLGKHNLENVCAAVMAATLAGVSRANIAKVLEEFGGLEHRLEFVGEKNGILFYNDSLATVTDASVAAMEALPDTETLIAGGYDRGLDYSNLVQYLDKGQIKTLILFPPTGKRIWEEVCKSTSEEGRPKKFDVTTMEQAVRIAAAETAPHKICLLSPASASFGTFKDYKDRGNQFKKEIARLHLPSRQHRDGGQAKL